MNEEIILKIEKLSNLGFGIAKNNGQVCFIKNACPQDEVKAQIVKQNKNYTIAEISEIIVPSPYRIVPHCPLHKICGSCQLQFIDYEYQLKLKKQIIEDVMKNIAGIPVDIRDVIPSPKIWGCRRKIQYAVRSTRNSKRLKIGYFQNKTHDIINTKYCPIQPKICDAIVDFIRDNAQNFSITGYDEKTHSGDLRHIVMRSSSRTDEILLTLVVNLKTADLNLVNFAKKISNSFPEISGVCLNFNEQRTNLILTNKTQCIYGKPFITEKICDIKFQIETNTFFQVNPESAENIFKFVKNHISSNFKNPTILDAYAGITAFGFVLADISKSVVSVEECYESVELAKKVQDINKISNVELNHMDAGKFFKNALESGKRFDVVILDPPRKGCSEESLKYAFELSKNQIIYISCNPATLARDLKFLTNLGAKVKFLQPFDMFCHTYHVESVVIIEV